MKVLVLGDSCIDKFIYGDINRICPEAPVPVFKPLYYTHNKGMASNVAHNFRALGVKATLITNKNQITKTRYIDHKSGQMVIRVDDEDGCDPFEEILPDLSLYDAVVISDYDKGFLTQAYLEDFDKKLVLPIFLDSKKKLGDWCEDFSFVKINEHERQQNENNYSFSNAIITKGGEGATYKGVDYPVEERVKVSNTAGAGDTFLAGLVFEYLKNQDIISAIRFANRCASKVVQQRGVTTV